MILLFDLDDTLYAEETYVRSGFREVTFFLKTEFSIDEEVCFKNMWHLLKSEGRGKIFDRVLQKYDLNSRRNVNRCVAVYRSHFPKITLPWETKVCLNRFRGLSKYVITDGNKIVQANKVKALGIERYVKKVFITHRYGTKYAKPSPYCFQKVAEIEKVPMSELVYIGDNPNKDFVGIKPLGCKTVRINQGMFKDYFLDAKHEADIVIKEIKDLDFNTLEKLKNVKYQK